MSNGLRELIRNANREKVEIVLNHHYGSFIINYGFGNDSRGSSKTGYNGVRVDELEERIAP